MRVRKSASRRARLASSRSPPSGTARGDSPLRLGEEGQSLTRLERKLGSGCETRRRLAVGMGDGAAWSTGNALATSRCDTGAWGRRRCSFYVLRCFVSLVKIKSGTKGDLLFSSAGVPGTRQPPPKPARTGNQETLLRKISPATRRTYIPLASVSLLLCRKKMRLLYTLHSPRPRQARLQANRSGAPLVCPNAAS